MASQNLRRRLLFVAISVWTALIGSPSTKKTPIMNAAMRPLNKIDAEGAEQAIFNGMQSVLRKRPAILLEFNAGRYVDAAGFLARLCAYAGSMKVVGFDGNLAPITASTVLERRPFDDWLLFFEP